MRTVERTDETAVSTVATLLDTSTDSLTFPISSVRSAVYTCSATRLIPVRVSFLNPGRGDFDSIITDRQLREIVAATLVRRSRLAKPRGVIDQSHLGVWHQASARIANDADDPGGPLTVQQVSSCHECKN